MMSNAQISLRHGGHEIVPSRKSLPFRYVDRLGSGLSAVVDLVQHEETGRLFAHKAFHRYWGRESEKYKQAFQNEIDIIKRLSSHPHMIEVYWSYECTNANELGMLLNPVASQGDLRAYLRTIKDSGSPPSLDQVRILNRAFGCLANGLAFIHSHTIRHKDIKPHNILVHDGNMIFADFGIAFSAGVENATTTTGRPEAYTMRYCAPEVANHEGRNRKSDVFSLGCVYLDILDALQPGGFLEAFAYDAYWQVVDKIRDNLPQSEECQRHHIHGIGLCHTMLEAVCVSMLEPDKSRRIGSKELVGRFWAVHSTEQHPQDELFCDDCTSMIRQSAEARTPDPRWDCRMHHGPWKHPELTGQPGGLEQNLPNLSEHNLAVFRKQQLGRSPPPRPVKQLRRIPPPMSTTWTNTEQPATMKQTPLAPEPERRSPKSEEAMKSNSRKKTKDRHTKRLLWFVS